MNEVQVMEQNGQRVLTTAQLAESYGTDNKVISNNFNRNKDRYKEGKHFVQLSGEEKREFINLHQIEDGSKNAQVLYLWTKKGALMHAKSLNTDEAWEAYEMLVDQYYELQEILTAEQQVRKQLELSIMTSVRVDSIEQAISVIQNTMRIDGVEQYQINDAGKRKALAALGGKHTTAYKLLNRKAFSELWRDFKQYFEVPRYSELPKMKYSEAMEFISIWEPSAALKMEIRNLNGQLTLV